MNYSINNGKTHSLLYFCYIQTYRFQAQIYIDTIHVESYNNEAVETVRDATVPSPLNSLHLNTCESMHQLTDCWKENTRKTSP
jgi:hypothetical protein